MGKASHNASNARCVTAGKVGRNYSGEQYNKEDLLASVRGKKTRKPRDRVIGV